MSLAKDLNNKALALYRAAEYPAALAIYKSAVAQDPELFEAAYGVGLCSLMLGDIRAGAAHYRARLRRYGASASHFTWPDSTHDFAVVADQGLGEQIMFASALVGAPPCRVVTDWRLETLFKRSFPQLDVSMPRGEPAPAAHAYLSDLALSAPAPVGCAYLKPDPAAVDRFRRKYDLLTSGARLIGFSWKSIGTKDALQKTVPLERWGPIFTRTRTVFIPLQYGSHPDELERIPTRCTVLDDPTVDPMENIDLLAAQIAALDCVVTSSNFVAHLAGALGVQTYVMIPKGFGHQWHWFLERADSPWYPKVHIARQTTIGDWFAPITEVAALLNKD